MTRHWPIGRQGGFSLTELLIVIVIVGVLAGIGLPAYQDYARKSKRSDAHQGLSRMAQLQERFFTDNNRYAADVEALGYEVPLGMNDVTPTTGGYWLMSVEEGDALRYVLQAVPNPDEHSDADCATVTLDSTGVRSSTPPGAADCWSGR
jgi:type IV pilus assembly protein PilE